MTEGPAWVKIPERNRSKALAFKMKPTNYLPDRSKKSIHTKAKAKETMDQEIGTGGKNT